MRGDGLVSRFTRHAGGRSHDLGQMGPRDLITAYFSYWIVLLYIAVCLGAGWGLIRFARFSNVLGATFAGLLVIGLYPLIWYGLHRYMLHSRLLYRSPLTARLWRRIHFDHHQDPHRMDVLFGSPLTTLPTIGFVSLALGWPLGGWAGVSAAVLGGVGLTLVYEFCHCIQHLNYAPKHPWLLRIKTLHMAHHFHNETGNYGIISFWPDRLFGTLYEDSRTRTRSPTVFNLGYDGDEVARFPWVARSRGGQVKGTPSAAVERADP